MQEQEIRKRVRALREFYQSLIIYGLVNAGLVVIWAVSGGGYFWPIWVMVGWGLGLGVSAVSLGLLPQLSTLFPVFSDEWEEEQMKKYRQKKPSPSKEVSAPVVASIPSQEKSEPVSKKSQN